MSERMRGEIRKNQTVFVNGFIAPCSQGLKKEEKITIIKQHGPANGIRASSVQNFSFYTFLFCLETRANHMQCMRWKRAHTAEHSRGSVFRARRGGKRFNTEQIICYQIVNKLLNCAGFEVKSVRVDVHMLGSQRFFCDQEVRKFLSQIWHTSEKLCLY